MKTKGATISVSIRGTKWVKAACHVAKVMARLRLPPDWRLAVVNLGMRRVEWRAGGGKWKPLGIEATLRELYG